MDTAGHVRRVDQRGFAVMIVVIVILGLLAIGLGAVVPAMFQQIGDARERATNELLQRLHQGIVGDKQNSFGYYADVGDYPASLMDLVRDPGQDGWSGPYVDVGEGGIVNGQVVDFYGNPVEYFVEANVDNNPAYLAIVSRGPDGVSTNTDGTPNDTWAGTPPRDNTYMAQAGNADNLVFPLLDSVNNATIVEQVQLGTLRTTFTNFDYNTVVNANVQACFGLYTMTATPAARPSDVQTWYPGPVQLFDIHNGTWTITVTSPLATAPVYEQTLKILPNATTLQTVRLSSLDSRGTATFTLAIKNTYPTTDLDVYVSDVKQAASANRNSTTNYTVRGCAPIDITVKDQPLSSAIDSFTMPYGITTFTRYEGPPASVTVSIGNQNVQPELKVFYNGNNTVMGPHLGQMPDKERKNYVINSGDYLWITDADGIVIYGPTVQTASISLTCRKNFGCS